MKLKTTLIAALVALAAGTTALHTASAAGNGYRNNAGTAATTGLNAAETETMVLWYSCVRKKNWRVTFMTHWLSSGS
ncbi:MAG: hypothetical protein R3F02_02440 [Thiolinea sp.]